MCAKIKIFQSTIEIFLKKLSGKNLIKQMDINIIICSVKVDCFEGVS